MTKPSNSRSGIDRRSLLKYSVAGGAALATGTVYAPAVHAQAKPIKLGYVSPQTGPLAAFAEADNFVLGQFREAMKGGLKIGNATRPIEVSVKDSQSNPEPRRRGRQGADRARQGGPDAGRLDARDHQSRVHPVRDRGGGVRLDQGAVAAVVHRPAGQSRRRPASLETLQLRLPLLLGPGGRDRRLHQHVGPARRPTRSVGGAVPQRRRRQRLGRQEVGFPPVLDKQGYKLVDPGRYQNLTDNFSAQITAFKNAQCRDRHRRGAAARLHHVLEAGDCSRASSRRRPPSARPSCSRWRWRRSARTATTSPPRCGGRRAIPSSRRSTADSAKQLADAYEAATKKQWTQPIGFIHSLFEVATDVLKRTAEVGNAKARVEAIAATNLDTVVGKVAVERQGACRRSRPRTSPRRRWWAASGASRTATSTTSSSPTTAPRPTFRWAARWRRLGEGVGRACVASANPLSPSRSSARTGRGIG